VPTVTATIERTPLHEAHLKAGATMVDFHGWEMPIRYEQIPVEHQKVRLSAGLFDLCHMGRLEVTGRDAIPWIQSVITNDLEAMEAGDARYSLVVNEEGGILDDIIVYRLESSVLLVVNASNRERMVAWFEAHRPPGAEATLADRTREWAMTSIQGPQSVRILTPLIQLVDLGGWDLFDYYHIARGEALGKPVLISRTGYTGEDGFEIYHPAEMALELWTAMLEAGGARIAPIGLGARDTLRLEAGMPLYGNELNEQVNPFEARVEFAVKLKKTAPFTGQPALQAIKERGVEKRLVGFRIDSRKVARQSMPVFHGEERVGSITSGIPSPTLGFPIAMGYLDSKVVAPENLWVDIRGSRARIIPEPLPFFSRTRRRSDRAL
jgi:aminomethyltransferase